MEPLTAKQLKTLRFIESHLEKTGIAPTFREIAGHLGVSVGSAQTHVEGLKRKGFLSGDGGERLKRRARQFVLQNRGVGRRIPVLGRVPAGPLSEAIELSDDSITLDTSCVPKGEVFGLEVRGDSMIEAGILEDDIVIVRVQPSADIGDIVVARIGDEATVKRMAKSGGRTVLKPENPRYDPIPADDAEIVGKVIGLFRRL